MCRVERRGVKLRQHKHLVNAGVNAVADRDINQAIFTTNGHSGFGTILGQVEIDAFPVRPQK